MEGNETIVRGYSMPAWLVELVKESADRNARTDSAEVRLVLARHYGRNLDGTPIVCVAAPAEGASREA